MRGIVCIGLLAAGLARADEVKAPPFDMSSPDVLASGSELAAGIDPNAGQEITRPADLTSLEAGLRTAGGVFQNGKGSVALQANPFLLTYGRRREYREMVDARGNFGRRVLEDLAVTAVVSAGTPHGGDPSRFSTFGFGVTSELLGTRSPFSREFDRCVTGEEWMTKEKDLLRKMPSRADSGQPDFPAKKEAALDALKSAMTEQLERCRQRTRNTSHALYLTLGARWVGPGQARESGDPAVRVDREFAGFAYDLPPWKRLRVAAQARWLAQRPADDASLVSSLDAALSVQWANESFSLAAEGRRSAVERKSAESSASVAVTTKIRLPASLLLGLEVQGRGDDLGPAVRHPVAAVTLAYADDHVLLHRSVTVQ